MTTAITSDGISSVVNVVATTAPSTAASVPGMKGPSGGIRVVVAQTGAVKGEVATTMVVVTDESATLPHLEGVIRQTCHHPKRE